MAQTYAETVQAGLHNDKGMQEWAEYLIKLDRFQFRQKELIHALQLKRKGMPIQEAARKVLPILQKEKLHVGLPDYVINGY